MACVGLWISLSRGQERGPVEVLHVGYLPMRGAFLAGSSIFSPELWLDSQGAFLLYFPDRIGGRARLCGCWEPGAVLAQGQPLGCCMAVQGMLHRWDEHCWCF